ncbi:MAG: hypothetical protein KME11_03695 [Timaviella obliquedivisa GSE-PSE-MK23-08B]|nr:hypothetical protein [Timaviella obliquedivisa GSE-PSE-MK23-08B]
MPYTNVDAQESPAYTSMPVEFQVRVIAQNTLIQFLKSKRKTMRQSLKTFSIQGVWSESSAIVLLFVGILQLPQLGWQVLLFTIGAIAIRLIPTRYFRYKYGSAFYSAPS